MAGAGVIAASIVLLTAAHALPRVRRAHALKPVILMGAGFIAAQITIFVLVAALQVVPNLPPNQMVKYLAELPTDRPIILLVGSSLTQHGIDRDLLAERLLAAGHPVTIGRLGFGGMSIPERYHYASQYLAAARRRPSLVLFEISAYYEVEPLKQLQQNLYSDQEVAGMGFDTTWFSLAWVLGQGDDLPLAQRITLASEVLRHFLLNVVHAGFAQRGIMRDARLVPKSFDSAEQKRMSLGDEFLARALARAVIPLDDPPRGAIPSRWLVDILDREIEMFRGDGATGFGFYQTPTTLPQEFTYALRFCAATSAYPCILADDPTLHAGLSHDSDWYDEYHLIGPGRRLYTLWLADRLLAQMTLP